MGELRADSFKNNIMTKTYSYFDSKYKYYIFVHVLYLEL